MQADAGMWDGLQGIHLLQKTTLLTCSESTKVENTAFALLLLKREPLQGCKLSSVGNPSLVIMVHYEPEVLSVNSQTTVMKQISLCEAIPCHNIDAISQCHHPAFSFVSEDVRSGHFCVKQREKACWEGSFELFLGNALWPWALNPDTPHVSRLCFSPSKQGGASPQQRTRLSQLTSGYNSTK